MDDLIGSKLQLRKEMVSDQNTNVYRTSAGLRFITHCSSSAEGGCWQKKALIELDSKKKQKGSFSCNMT